MVYTITTTIKGKDGSEIQRDYEIDEDTMADKEKLGEILGSILEATKHSLDFLNLNKDISNKILGS